MTKNPFINALTATAYIALVVGGMTLANTYSGTSFTPFIPMAMLSLFTFSVAVMAFIFFFKPVQLYLDGKKKEGINLFLKTLGSFGAITLILLLVAIFIPRGNTEMETAAITSKTEFITVYSPMPNAEINSPLEIRGRARGPWFFEATFPVILTDWDGLIIAEGYATAQGDWMTEDYVPFTASLEFTKPSYGETGSLILQKANASGLPEHDDALEFTIKFK